jgi:hypothetical protein
MVTFGFNDDFFWSTYCQAIKFGEGFEFAIDGAPYTIFDTGSSHLMVPPLYYEPIVKGIIEATGGRAQYAVRRGTTFVDCNQRYLFQPLEFMFSEHYIRIDPKDYIWDMYGDGSVCTLLILANSYEFFLLGQPIYQQYYTIHNMGRSTISYAPLRNTAAEVPYSAPIPDVLLWMADPPSLWQLYGNYLVIALFIALGYYVVYPLFVGWWGDYSDANANNYYWGAGIYVFLCLIMYFFLLQPMLNLPPLNILGTQSDFHAVGFGAVIAAAFFRRSSPPKASAAASEKVQELEANSLI